MNNKIKKRIQRRLEKIAEALPDQGYSMGGERVAKCLSITGRFDDRDYYSKSCKFREKHGYYEVEIPLADIFKISVIGGLVTIVRSPGKIAEAEWFESTGKKQHFQIKRVSGFLTGRHNAATYDRYHAATYEDAVEWRKDEAGRLMRRRQQIRIAGLRSKNEKEYLRRLEKAEEEAKKLFYGFTHARQAGNCEPGIMQAVQDYNLNPEFGYRGEYLLQTVTNGRRWNVERMIEHRAKMLI